MKCSPVCSPRVPLSGSYRQRLGVLEGRAERPRQPPGLARHRSCGMTVRCDLYRALSGERSPDFATILKVTRALGVRLHASAV
ncbi:hypothetical protein CEE57_01670 [Stenotrophomonas maltophilia]|nr:hypothetical protein CEE57_01670 [Stenotrophomonas maltophilia]